MNKSARTLPFLLGATLLSVRLGAQTAVPVWQQTFRPDVAPATISPGVVATRELADGHVLVVTESLACYLYDHDGNLLSNVTLRAARMPRKKARPPSPGRPAAPGGSNPYPGYGRTFAQVDAFGAVFLTRVFETSPFPTTRSDIITTKYDGLTGQPLWPRSAVYDAGPIDYPTGLFLDPHGDVLLTGLSYRGGSNLQHLTLKYSGVDGGVLWGPNLIDDVGRPGTAALSGTSLWLSVARSTGDGTGTRFTTILYSGNDGSLFFGPLIAEGTATQTPFASTIAGSDYVVVGSADEEGSAEYMAAIAYSGFDGSVVWGPLRYHLPAGAQGAQFRDVASDAAGNLIACGLSPIGQSTSEYVVAKLAGSNGQMLWFQDAGAASTDTSGCRVSVAGNGDAILSGTTGASPGEQLAFWRYLGAGGAPLWGPVSVGSADSPDPSSWFVGSNGRVFAAQVLGNAPSAATNVFELSGDTGAIAWGPTPTSQPARGSAYLQDLSGGPNSTVAAVGYDYFGGTMYTLRYDRASGSKTWGPATLGGAYPVQSAVDANGDIVVLGVALSGGPPGPFVIKYSRIDGSVLWGPTTIGDGTGSPRRLALDSAGNAFVLLWVIAPDSMYLHTGVAKIDGSTGSVLWGPTLYQSSAANNDFGTAIAVTPGGDVIAVGDTESAAFQWFALKYSGADGSLLWGPPAPLDGQALAVASDTGGSALVTGYSGGGMTTIKYDGADGSVAWGPKYVRGSGNYVEQGDAIAVDAAGDVAVTGDVFNVGTGDDIGTIKYRGSDGATLWGPVFFDGEAHGGDSPNPLGVAFDDSGNVVVGGDSQTLDRYFDMVVLKYDGTNGSTLWGPVYVGGPEPEDMTGFSVIGNSIVVGGPSAGAFLVEALDEHLGIVTMPPQPPSGFCGVAYSFGFKAANGSGTYSWSVVSGSPPPGMILSATGILSGTPVGEGSFDFTVQVDDGVSTVSRAFSILVQEGPGPVPGDIEVNLLNCQYGLFVTGIWSSFQWLPGGETTPSIVVAPVETTTYGVVVGNGSGCLQRYSVTIPGTLLQDPACGAPSIVSIMPASGPASGGTAITVSGGHFENGAVLSLGSQTASGIAVPDPTTITASSPALEGGRLYDVVVVNPDTGNAALVRGWLADFLDVPDSDPFHAYVESVVRAGVTAGCGAGDYCPSAPTTRAQMAVFLLKSVFGPLYVPPTATGLFEDVPPNDPFAPWIEQLARMGVTAGCGGGNYCPNAPVTRAQMAVFLLKNLNGAFYNPPAPAGIFGDVPVSDPFAPWIEDIYGRGITGGCSASPLLYCPGSPTTRGQMAVFLVKTFNLP